MAIEFEFYKSPDPTGKDNNGYYARTVNKRTVNTDEIARRIQTASTLTIGDVKAVLASLTEEIINNLEESNRVHLDGIGYFQTTLQTSREIEPGKTRAQSVWFKSVKFRADKKLKQRLALVFTKRSVRKRHSAPLTDDEVDKKVDNFFRENKILNTYTMQFLCGFTKYAAGKHIKRLLAEGKIRNIYTNKNPVYVRGNAGDTEKP